mmetsp:Transcript_10513/g.30514  ORF Transcript_10513/g.30514 Transcript_10513/m.30514 type:complete len:228 (+) Transcript_10513:120-803(+)
MAEQWLTDFEKARKSALGLARDVGATQEGKSEAKQAALLRGHLSQLRQDVSHLEKSLMVMSQNTQAYSVTRKELSRRGDLLAQLTQQVEDLQEGIRLSTRRRNDAAAEPPWRDREARRTSRAGGDGAGPAQDFNAACDQETRLQDEAMDFLQGTVRSLKNIGGQISQEVDVHCQMLGELEDCTDDASVRLRQQQVKLSKLTEHSPICYLWAYVVCMSIVLFILLVFF